MTISSRQESLYAPLVEKPGWGSFGMCRMLQYLLLVRTDMAQTFDTTTDVGLADAIAWMFARALPERGLIDTVDGTTLHALNAAVAAYPGAKATSVPKPHDFNHDVNLSMLMALVWRHRPDVQALHDVCGAQGRVQYCVWFATHAVHEMGLQGLVSAPWRQWLSEPAAPLAHLGLPRIGLLSWLAREDLQDAFDLHTAGGLTGLKHWTAQRLAQEPGWAWLVEGATGAQAQQPRVRRWLERPLPRPGVNLIGYASGTFGIGEDLRMAVAACQAADIAYSVVPIAAGPASGPSDCYLQSEIDSDADARFPVNIFCMTPFDTVQVFLSQGPQLFRHRYNIGWWPWELPVWPQHWQAVFELVDEVWAASTFTADTYRLACGLPVHLMPLPVDISRAHAVGRASLGLPTDSFLFLFVFDCNSLLRRKNPLAVVKAFRTAFAVQDASVGLVLKAMNARADDPLWRALQRASANDPRIVLLTETMERGTVLGLTQACDAYVSLHRAEGFGRTLAEAMLFGKPVVATDFSGSTDFVTDQTGFPVAWARQNVLPGEYPYVETADAPWWAEPDVAQAARQLKAARLAASKPAFAEQVQQFAKRQFSPVRIGQLMQQRLDGILSARLDAAGR